MFFSQCAHIHVHPANFYTQKFSDILHTWLGFMALLILKPGIVHIVVIHAVPALEPELWMLVFNM